MITFKKIIKISLSLLLLSLASCGVNDGSAIGSGGSGGAVPLVSADCSGNSCM